MNFLQFIEIYVLLQPALDLVTSLSARTAPNLPTVGMLARLAFVAVACGYILFFDSGRFSALRKGAVLIVTVYGILNALCAGYYNGWASLLETAKMFCKTYYFVYVLLLFFALYRGKRFVIRDGHLAFVYLAYTGGIFLAAVTGTGFSTYTHWAGTCGWFYAGNEVGAIVGALAGTALLWAFKRGVLPSLLVSALTAFCASRIGTKVPFLAILGAGAVLFLLALLRKDWPKLRRSALLLLAILLLYGLNSPLKQNTAALAQDGGGAQEQITEDGSAPKSGLYQALNWLLSDRLELSANAVDAYAQSPAVRKLLGLGYGFHTADGETYSLLIEMDLLALLINHGILGLALFLGPLAVLAGACLRKWRRLWRSERAVVYSYSILIALACAVLSGHVFTAPAASLYPAILTVKLYGEE